MSVHNGERFLPMALESILEQSFRDYEFIIVNDGSTDATASMLESYQRADSRVRVLHQENRGLVMSLNQGVELARGMYIARMDSDDIAVGDRLERQVREMERCPKVGVIGGAVEVIDAMGRVLGTMRFPTRDVEIKGRLAVGECALCHPAVLMRTDVVRSVGGYRAVAVDAEDYDLWLRIADRYQLGNLGTVVLRYRRHAGQVSVERFRRQALSALAACSAALSRRRGGEDFLDKMKEITPSLLEAYGVGGDRQQAALARGYLTCIRSMSDAGEFTVAKDKMRELSSLPYWKRAERSLVADYHLLAARIHWRQRRAAKSLSSAMHAVISRPIILARPLKSLLHGIGAGARFDVVMSRLRAALGLPSGRSG